MKYIQYDLNFKNKCLLSRYTYKVVILYTTYTCYIHMQLYIIEHEKVICCLKVVGL